jgi:hypothetical protein
MVRSWPQRWLLTALLASLGAAPVSRAQVPPFFIPVGPEILVAPLLLLLLPLGLMLTQTDEKTVRDLEARGDWAAIVALADRRLTEHADEATWREIRGRALQRSGRCVLATPDLQAAFDLRQARGAAADEAAFQIGLALGLCEMQSWQLDAAAGTMQRLAAIAPARWEPPYQLGIIAGLRGEPEAADRAVATLAAIDAPRAASLRRELALQQAGRRGAAPTPATAGPAPSPPRPRAPAPIDPSVRLAGNVLSVGDRALVLPGEGWVLQSSARHAVRSSRIRLVMMVDEVPLVTVRSVATTPDGELAAALAFTSNPRRAYGTAYWDGEDFCAVRDAIHVDRFERRLERPECAYVRLLDLDDESMSPRLAPAVTAALRAGATMPAQAYEIHYSRYGQDWMVAATWLLPTPRLAGDLAAVQWLRDLAAQLAPLARQPNALPAMVPPLGPGGGAPAAASLKATSGSPAAAR